MLYQLHTQNIGQTELVQNEVNEGLYRGGAFRGLEAGAEAKDHRLHLRLAKSRSAIERLSQVMGMHIRV